MGIESWRGVVPVFRLEVNGNSLTGLVFPFDRGQYPVWLEYLPGILEMAFCPLSFDVLKKGSSRGDVHFTPSIQQSLTRFSLINH